MQHAEDNDGYNDFLKQLIECNLLEEKVAGIAKKVISDGIESLSPKQKFVFEKGVTDEYVTKECTRCGLNIPWEEMLAASEDGLCSWCRHQEEKDDKYE